MEFSTNQWLPLTNPQRTKAQDIKLWKCDEARENVARLEQYRCPCRICPCAQPLKHTTIQKHLLDFGRHLHNRIWHKYMHDVRHSNHVIILWFIMSDAWKSIAFVYTLNLINWKGLITLICMFMVRGSIWFIWWRMGGRHLSSTWPLSRPFDGIS
jgi:hypothetical protein